MRRKKSWQLIGQFARPQLIAKFSSLAFVCDTPFILRRWPHFHSRTKVTRSPCNRWNSKGRPWDSTWYRGPRRPVLSRWWWHKMKQKEPRASFGPALSSRGTRSSRCSYPAFSLLPSVGEIRDSKQANVIYSN